MLVQKTTSGRYSNDPSRKAKKENELKELIENLDKGTATSEYLVDLVRKKCSHELEERKRIGKEIESQAQGILELQVQSNQKCSAVWEDVSWQCQLENKYWHEHLRSLRQELQGLEAMTQSVIQMSSLGGKRKAVSHAVSPVSITKDTVSADKVATKSTAPSVAANTARLAASTKAVEMPVAATPTKAPEAQLRQCPRNAAGAAAAAAAATLGSSLCTALAENQEFAESLDEMLKRSLEPEQYRDQVGSTELVHRLTALRGAVEGLPPGASAQVKLAKSKLQMLIRKKQSS
eukprot:TRINITY_DN39467_c0_g2_i1.p1 TRINITY_DN39467_c0_g2~~TRINITY_DN39467_c0_g2_i1.p1  ORF type:complete len:309 (+),score=51.57 TRINITY_DN39467_c0_g2_i1:57-929(+)